MEKFCNFCQHSYENPGIHWMKNGSYSFCKKRHQEKSKESAQRAKTNPERYAKMRNRKNAYERKRRQEDKAFKLMQNLRRRVRRYINKDRRPYGNIDALGCTLPFFFTYIESLFLSGMSWENYGQWELDHIYPISKANLEDTEEFKRVCHYTNLQPLWRLDNRIKSNKIE